MAFVVGPMCAVNRISADPPSHRDCATYSAQVCPFLANPTMRRRPITGIDNTTAPPGHFLQRNPGVALVWTTRKYTVSRVDNGWLYNMTAPTAVEWWAHGRPATRTEVLTSMATGLPELKRLCHLDANPDQSLQQLANAMKTAIALAPPEPDPGSYEHLTEDEFDQAASFGKPVILIGREHPTGR